jgi:hypothetical protein
MVVTEASAGAYIGDYVDGVLAFVKLSPIPALLIFNHRYIKVTRDSTRESVMAEFIKGE